jgi:hypothetical protein
MQVLTIGIVSLPADLIQPDILLYRGMGEPKQAQNRLNMCPPHSCSQLTCRQCWHHFEYLHRYSDFDQLTREEGEEASENAEK